MISVEFSAVVIVIAIAAAIGFLVTGLTRRRARRVRDVITPVLTAAGWSGMEPTMLGVRAMWHALPVELAYGPRQKGVPQRFILKMRRPSESRLIVKRRRYGFLSRPFTLWGPPILEMRQPAAQGLWVRSDEPALAERVFSDDRLVSMISANLVAAFDEIRVNRGGIRIVRSLDDRPVRAKYNFPMMTMKFEPEHFEPIAREMVALGEALSARVP